MTINQFKISVNDEGTPIMTNPMTFEKIIERIKHMGLENNVTIALINKARTVPPGSLEHFVNNIHTYVANLTRETHGHKNQQT